MKYKNLLKTKTIEEFNSELIKIALEEIKELEIDLVKLSDEKLIEKYGIDYDCFDNFFGVNLKHSVVDINKGSRNLFPHIEVHYDTVCQNDNINNHLISFGSHKDDYFLANYSIEKCA